MSQETQETTQQIDGFRVNGAGWEINISALSQQIEQVAEAAAEAAAAAVLAAKADKTDVDNANLVVAEAIAALRRDISGVQKMLSENAGDLNVKTIDVEEGSFQLGQKQFALVTSAPTEIPRSTGLMRFNPSNGALYVSKSVTNSTSDWVRVQ